MYVSPNCVRDEPDKNYCLIRLRIILEPADEYQALVSACNKHCLAVTDKKDQAPGEYWTLPLIKLLNFYMKLEYPTQFGRGIIHAESLKDHRTLDEVRSLTSEDIWIEQENKNNKKVRTKITVARLPIDLSNYTTFVTTNFPDQSLELPVRVPPPPAEDPDHDDPAETETPAKMAATPKRRRRRRRGSK